MNPFEYRQPTQESIESIIAVRHKCAELWETILQHVPDHTREQSIAITHLEQVSMWANKGIVFHQGAGIPEAVQKVVDAPSYYDERPEEEMVCAGCGYDCKVHAPHLYVTKKKSEENTDGKVRG